ncbi:hypothetical protein EV714DRAFT_273469 [Schizophyllum commune]
MDDLDMPQERCTHAVHITTPVFAGAPGYKKDFCQSRREEAHSSLVHRHVYGKPYREDLSGTYSILQHLTRFGTYLGSGVSTQLCLLFRDEHDAQRASAVWYTADMLSELTESDMEGCAAIAAVCPHPMRGKLRPSEDDVKSRLQPYYDRVIPSKNNPKLFYATFATLDAAVAALHRSDLTTTEAGLVVEVYDCATVWVTLESSEGKNAVQTAMFDKLDECGVILNIDAKFKAMSSRTVEFTFPKPQLGRAFALNTLYRSPAVVPAFRFIRPQPVKKGSPGQRADAPPPYSATRTPLVFREIKEKPRAARDDQIPLYGKAEKSAIFQSSSDNGGESASTGGPIDKVQMSSTGEKEKPDTPCGTVPGAPPAYSIAPTRRRSRPLGPTPSVRRRVTSPAPVHLAMEAITRLTELRDVQVAAECATHEGASPDAQKMSQQLQAVPHDDLDSDALSEDREQKSKATLHEDEIDMMNFTAELNALNGSCGSARKEFERSEDALATGLERKPAISIASRNAAEERYGSLRRKGKASSAAVDLSPTPEELDVPAFARSEAGKSTQHASSRDKPYKSSETAPSHRAEKRNPTSASSFRDAAADRHASSRRNADDKLAGSPSTRKRAEEHDKPRNVQPAVEARPADASSDSTRRRSRPSTPTSSGHGKTVEKASPRSARSQARKEPRAMPTATSDSGHTSSARRRDPPLPASASHPFLDDIQRTQGDLERSSRKIDALRMKRKSYEQRLAIIKGEAKGSLRSGDTEKALSAKLSENKGELKLAEGKFEVLQRRASGLMSVDAREA